MLADREHLSTNNSLLCSLRDARRPRGGVRQGRSGKAGERRRSLAKLQTQILMGDIGHKGYKGCACKTFGVMIHELSPLASSYTLWGYRGIRKHAL